LYCLSSPPQYIRLRLCDEMAHVNRKGEVLSIYDMDSPAVQVSSVYVCVGT
jgi:hypothetical protein